MGSIEVDAALVERKVAYLQARISEEERVIAALLSHVAEMKDAVKTIERGDARSVNLRRATAPPKIEGVTLRFSFTAPKEGTDEERHPTRRR
jgi:hypothetical protein